MPGMKDYVIQKEEERDSRICILCEQYVFKGMPATVFEEMLEKEGLDHKGIARAYELAGMMKESEG